MLYETFHYMVFTRYSAGKIWSSICWKDISKAELHHQINLIGLINIITRFLYQICLTDKSDGNNYCMFRTQSRIKKQVKYLRWSYCSKTVNYFYKKLHHRSLIGVLNASPEYLKLNAIQNLNLPFKQWCKDR